MSLLSWALNAFCCECVSCDQVIKNLVFLAKVLKRVPDPEGDGAPADSVEVNEEDSGDEEEQEEQEEQDEEEEVEEADEEDATVVSLSWLVDRVTREARIEAAKYAKSTNKVLSNSAHAQEHSLFISQSIIAAWIEKSTHHSPFYLCSALMCIQVVGCCVYGPG